MAFKAPDGSSFNTKSELNKYLMSTYYTFEAKEGETLVKQPGEIDGQPFELHRLTNCEVMLLDHSETVQVDVLEGCKVFIAASAESVFVRNCRDCTFTIACKQLRTRDCHNCIFCLYAKTDPVVEESKGLIFMPFNGAYPELGRHLQQANLDPSVNAWYKIYDFSEANNKWDANSGNNWRYASEQEEANQGLWAPLGPCECPVPRVVPAFGMPQTPGDPMSNLPLAPQNAAFEEEDQWNMVESSSATIPMEMPPPPPLDIGPNPGSGSKGGTGLSIGSIGSPETDASLQLKAEFEAQVAARAAEEQKVKAAAKSKAEKDLDVFYDQRTDRIAHMQSLNREKEEQYLKTMDEVKAAASEAPWRRVCELVELNQGARLETEAQTAKMRSLLIQLKSEK